MRMGCKPSACAKPIPSLTGAAGCGGAVRTADRVRLWMRSPPVGDDLHLMIMPTPLVSGSTDEAAAARAGKPADALVYLPLQARKDTVWTAILDRETAKPLACLPLDSF